MFARTKVTQSGPTRVEVSLTDFSIYRLLFYYF